MYRLYSFEKVFTKRFSAISNIVLALGLAVNFCLCSSSFAKDNPPPLELTLERALQISLDKHPAILAANLEYQAALQELSAARWLAFPNVGLSLRGYQEEEGGNTLDQEILSISQPVWTGGKISGGIKLAKARSDSSKIAVTEAEQTILGDTVVAFVELHRAKLKVAISRSNVAEHERLFNIIERRVNASASPEVDLRLAKARLAFSRSQLLQNKNIMAISKAKLEQLIGRPVVDVGAPQHAELDIPTLADARTLAVSFAPSIKMMKAEIVGLRASEKVAKSALYPQVSIGYEKNFGELPSGQEPEQVFLSLDFQPGAGLSSRASILASGSKKAAMQNKLAELEREIIRDVDITWRELSAAEMQLSPTQLLVESTSDVVDSYLRQYTVGRKSWLDVLNAQRELVQAEQALVDHKAMLTIASYKMRILLGSLTGSTVRIKR